MFSSGSLKFKLVSAFMAVTVFMVLVAGVGYWCLNKVHYEYDYIAKIVVDNLKTTGDMGDRLRDMHLELVQIEGITTFESRKAHQDKWLKLVEEQNDKNKKYESIPFAPGEDKVWNHYKEGWNHYVSTGKSYLKLTSSDVPGDKEQATALFEKELPESYSRIRNALSEVWDFHEGVAEEKGTLADKVYGTANISTTIISIAGIIFALCLGLYLANMISKAITKFSNEISSSADQTSTASLELTSASSQLSQGATESAASLEETVSSLEELSSMVKLNSDHAKEANSLSQKSLHEAESGEKEIGRLIEAMSVMAKSSEKIEEIINVIDDIAFQTNLLALNAAVEAARAGEQGKGFAVVADAVRNLAGRSAAAAKDINSLIKENVARTEDGVQIADTSGTVLKEIVNSVKKVADLNSEIAAASQEQANGIEQISKAMNHLDQAIQTNASSSEEVASSAEEMSSQSECLKSLVGELRHFIHGHRQVIEKTSKSLSPVKAPIKKYSVVSKENNKKSPANILPFDDKNDSTIGKAEGF
ncbi:methyl-accepting chemotaxis protein [Peredibacter sp. HCB2-198]|uniref:HAMP domain-containing methyl-accepting chemotaxis protein n=1 Tax=Peredibacter sp. HCB2-198 TaxID=3383025 RepID=UPI0038B49870